jgi:hypothetical protein
VYPVPNELDPGIYRGLVQPAIEPFTVDMQRHRFKLQRPSTEPTRRTGHQTETSRGVPVNLTFEGPKSVPHQLVATKPDLTEELRC